MQTLRLQIINMHCAGCVKRIEKIVRNNSSVHDVVVNLASGRVRIMLQEMDVASYIEEDLRKAGFDSHRLKERGWGDNSLAQKKDSSWQVVTSLVLAGIFLPDMILSHFSASIHAAMILPHEIQFILSSLALFIPGWHFHKGAWSAIRNLVPDMSMLVSIGSFSAWGLSIFSMLSGGTESYFEAPVFVIAFVLAGKSLEQRARRKSGSYLLALASLQPQTARLKRDDDEMVIPVDDLLPGDRVVIRPGEIIPADSVILDGTASIDMAHLTGESRLVDMGPGQKISAGSFNRDGSLLLEVMLSVEESAIVKMVQILEDAQTSKASMQRLADRISAIFIPLVLILAVITFAGWWLATGSFSHALLNAVSLMVIACPCAMGLASPVAVVAGTSAALSKGILIHDVASFERVNKISMVAFDKTGTLTDGKQQLVSIKDCAGEGEQNLLIMAASIALGSEHSLAKALVKKAGEEGINLKKMDNFCSHAGKGITASLDNCHYALGNQAFLEELGVHAPYLQDDDKILPGACSWLAVIRPDTRLLARFQFEDQPRPSSAGLIKLLKNSGISTVILTGDHPLAASHMADFLGVEHWQAQLLPEEKVAAIRQMQDDGHVVAMVGDGVNDAAALAQADIGIAMGDGSDLARSAASMTLMRSDPALVIDALEIARLMHRKIIQCLSWAFLFNIIAIPFAAFGALTPGMAGLAMACSSLAVVLNAIHWGKSLGQKIPPTPNTVHLTI